MGEQNAASFRDPSGIVYRQNGVLFRQVNQNYKKDYELLFSSGLYDTLTEKKYLIPHSVVQEKPFAPQSVYKILKPQVIDFLSFPYEWSFSQFKDAALLTLDIQNEALSAGMTLKDASAYNIQFQNGKPIFIDTTSFVEYVEGTPWVAYRQFCQHFLAPLALMGKIDLRLQELLVTNIDGIPLDLCSRLLPLSTRFDFGLLSHIHLHAQAEKRYASTKDAGNQKQAPGAARVSRTGLLGLIANLEKTVKKLEPVTKGVGWVNYYEDTNYSSSGVKSKTDVVLEWVKRLNPKLVIDLGANTGRFSREVAAQTDCLVISSDIDPEAVELNYLQTKEVGETNLLPLVIDLANPSPAIGWDNCERQSFFERSKADVVLALALIHHLAISNHVPFSSLAKTFAALGKNLILEFVPKDDSQVERLLRSRDDIFDEYDLDNLIEAFKPFFDLADQKSVAESKRTLLLFKQK